jgi:hypothetical protein
MASTSFKRGVTGSKNHKMSRKRALIKGVKHSGEEHVSQHKIPRIASQKVSFTRGKTGLRRLGTNILVKASVVASKKSSVLINPYAKVDGTPKKGKEDLFFAWARKKRQKQLNTLSPKEKAKKRAAENALARKMNS